jgi:hypothetical protein
MSRQQAEVDALLSAAKDVREAFAAACRVIVKNQLTVEYQQELWVTAPHIKMGFGSRLQNAIAIVEALRTEP